MPWENVGDMATERQIQYLTILERALYGEVKTNMSALTKRQASELIECAKMNVDAKDINYHEQPVPNPVIDYRTFFGLEPERTEERTETFRRRLANYCITETERTGSVNTTIVKAIGRILEYIYPGHDPLRFQISHESTFFGIVYKLKDNERGLQKGLQVSYDYSVGETSASFWNILVIQLFRLCKLTEVVE
jgi:hypothetical protein